MSLGLRAPCVDLQLSVCKGLVVYREERLVEMLLQYCLNISYVVGVLVREENMLDPKPPAVDISVNAKLISYAGLTHMA